MTAYYNEFDPYCAQWLRNLIARGHIADGYVDERSIEDVRPADLVGFTQCHFFAGVGVWSYAARLAGWHDDRPLWTGSCPCQPFSTSGKGGGFGDERHLWPAFEWLIRECGPAVVVGEQVADKRADPWVDLVQSDLEALDYAFGCVPFPAASVGAPHKRDRNYWLAHSTDVRRLGWRGGVASDGRASSWVELERLRDARQLAHSSSTRLEGHGRNGDDSRQPGRFDAQQGRSVAETGAAGVVAHGSGIGRREEREVAGRRAGGDRAQGVSAGLVSGSPTNGIWSDADWLFCRDGKWRPVEPGTFPLAHGAASRVGRLRAYGNAIVAEQAKVFLACVIETLDPDAL